MGSQDSDLSLLGLWQREVDIVRVDKDIKSQSESAYRLAQGLGEKALQDEDEAQKRLFPSLGGHGKVDEIRAKATYLVAFDLKTKMKLGDIEREWMLGWLDRSIEMASLMNENSAWYTKLTGKLTPVKERTQVLEKILGFRPYKEDWLEELNLPTRDRKSILKGARFPKPYMNRRMFPKVECYIDKYYDSLKESGPWQYISSRNKSYLASPQRFKTYAQLENAFYKATSRSSCDNIEGHDLVRKILDFVACNSRAEERLKAMAGLAVSAYEPALDWGYYPLVGEFILERKEAFLGSISQTSRPSQPPQSLKWHQRLIDAIKSA